MMNSSGEAHSPVKRQTEHEAVYQSTELDSYPWTYIHGCISLLMT